MTKRDLSPLSGASARPTGVLVTSLASPSRPRTVTWLHHAAVSRVTPDPRGAVHWVPPGQIALYTVRGHKTRTFVFRTAAQRATLLSSVPGVSPRVTLLVQTTTLARQALLLGFFRSLIVAGRSPTSLDDLLFAKLNVLLSRRAPTREALDGLLSQHDAPRL